MNAQSTHPIRTSITHTTDPQFLGPESGQQAEVKAGGGQAHELGDMRVSAADAADLVRVL